MDKFQSERGRQSKIMDEYMSSLKENTTRTAPLEMGVPEVNSHGHMYYTNNEYNINNKNKKEERPTAIEKLLESYEKDIGSTLHSFEMERNKQSEELSKLRVELANYEKERKGRAQYVQRKIEEEEKGNALQLINAVNNERDDNHRKIAHMENKIRSLEDENLLLNKDMNQMKTDVEHGLSSVGSPRFTPMHSNRRLHKYSSKYIYIYIYTIRFGDTEHKP